MYAEVLTPVEHEGKRNAWAVFWQSITRVEPEKATPWLALRNSIGITLPIAIGLISGAVSSWSHRHNRGAERLLFRQ